MNYLIFHQFPIVVDKLITIPKNILLFRGYHTGYPAISSRPTFYGNYNTADLYSNESYERLGAFITNSELKLIDLRYAIMLLREMINYISINLHQEIVRAITLAYGLCSFNKQFEILEEYYGPYKNEEIHQKQLKFIDSFKINPDIFKVIANIRPPPEIQGFRIAITSNDAKVVLFMKELLKPFGIDGFIAPKIYTPFREFAFQEEEIVIFDPLSSNIKLNIPHLKKNGFERLSSIRITDLIQKYVSYNSVLDFTGVVSPYIRFVSNIKKQDGGDVKKRYGNINDYFALYEVHDRDTFVELEKFNQLCQKEIPKLCKQLETPMKYSLNCKYSPNVLDDFNPEWLAPTYIKNTIMYGTRVQNDNLIYIDPPLEKLKEKCF